MKTILNILLILSSSIGLAQTEGWNRLSAPTKGEVVSLEVTEDRTIYAITTSGKLYCCKSNSNDWQSSTIPVPEYSPYRFEYHADFSGYQFINYSSGNSYTAPSFGIYRSIDNGLTWQQVIKKMDVPRLIQSRKGILYALREWNNINTTLFSSTNNGDTWDSISSFPFKAVDMTINDEEKIYITINDYQRTVLIYNTVSGLYSKATYNTVNSVYSDATTILMYKGIPFVKSSDTCFYIDKDNSLIKRGQIGTSPYTFPRPIVSSPNGSLFTLSTTSLNSQSIKILYSRDTGVHWDSFPSFPPARAGSESPYNVHLAVDSNEILYCGTPSGVFSSNDLGKSWKSLGLPICNIPLLQKGPNNSIFIHDSSKTFYAAGYFRYAETRLLQSSDRGESWDVTNFTPGGVSGRFFYDNNGGIYYWELVNNKSFDTKLWYSDISAPYSFELHNTSLYIPASVATDDQKLYGVFPGTGVLYTTDKGVSWDAINLPQTGTIVGSFAIDRNHRFYAGFNPGLYTSSDEGISWKKLNTGIKNASIISIKLIEPNTIIVGTSSDGVWHSTDAGSTWERWDFGIRDTVTAIEVIGNRCYVGTNGGLLSCEIGSDNWKNELFVDEEIRIHQILNYNDECIYVTPEDMGIWKMPLTNTYVPITAPAHSTIRYIVGKAGHSDQIQIIADKSKYISIDMYNILGVKLKEITNNMLIQNEISIPVNGANLPNGTYMIMVRSEVGVQTEKVIITR